MLSVPDHVLRQVCQDVQNGTAVERLCEWWNSERASSHGPADLVTVYIRRGEAWRSLCHDDNFSRTPWEIEQCADCARAGIAILEFRRLATDGDIDLSLNLRGECIESAPASVGLFQKWSRQMVAELAVIVADDLNPHPFRENRQGERRSLETT